ncbi:MAG: DUF177 domain-containing protein [Pseudomonadota bacterium]
MAAPLPITHPIATTALVESGGMTVELRPEAGDRAAIAAYLRILSLDSLVFRASLAPQLDGWALTGQLAADLAQACVVTLEPVAARVETPVARVWLPGIATPEGNELELREHDDEAPEPLGATIDLAQPMIEALALALDPFPRAPDAEHGARVYAPPGAEALTDEAARPFAGLAALKSRLGGEGNGGNGEA